MQVALAAATSISRKMHPTLARRQPQLSTLRQTVGQATQGSLGMWLMLPHRCAIGFCRDFPQHEVETCGRPMHRL